MKKTSCSCPMLGSGVCESCLSGVPEKVRVVTHLNAPPPAPVTATTADGIRKVCDGIRDMLLAKNAAYGDSALSPVRIFSKASTEEQLLVRIDDKLSRLARGSAAGEDVVDDLIGYLVLLKVSRSR